MALGEDASRIAVATTSEPATAPVASFTNSFMNPGSSLRLAIVAAKAGIAALVAFVTATSDSCVWRVIAAMSSGETIPRSSASIDAMESPLLLLLEGKSHSESTAPNAGAAVDNVTGANEQRCVALFPVGDMSSRCQSRSVLRSRRKVPDLAGFGAFGTNRRELLAEEGRN